MTDFMIRCIGAARKATLCDECDEQSGNSVTHMLQDCDYCAANIVRAVLDEFVRKPSKLALSAFASSWFALSAFTSSCWEREAVEKILQAQRKSCND